MKKKEKREKANWGKFTKLNSNELNQIKGGSSIMRRTTNPNMPVGNLYQTDNKV